MAVMKRELHNQARLLFWRAMISANSQFQKKWWIYLRNSKESMNWSLFRLKIAVYNVDTRICSNAAELMLRINFKCVTTNSFLCPKICFDVKIPGNSSESLKRPKAPRLNKFEIEKLCNTFLSFACTLLSCLNSAISFQIIIFPFELRPLVGKHETNISV